MTNSSLFRNVLLWIILLVPFIYLGLIYNGLPEQVPTHFNVKGEADDWSHKSTLWIIPALLTFGTYVLMIIIPYIDPKKQIQNMGKKYEDLKLMMVLMMSAISFFIIYSAQGNPFNTNLLFALIGFFYVLMGNYFPTIKHNYFIGLRTPWTLEKKEVWRKTHQMAGPLWMIGGLLIVFICLLVKESELAFILFMTVTMVISIVPLVYSYVVYK